MTERDKDLNDLIRAASERDVDEGAIFRCVVDRIDQAEDRTAWFRLPSFGPGTAAAGFAAMMIIAGAAGYTLPDLALGTPEDDFLVLAMGGDPLTSALWGTSE